MIERIIGRRCLPLGGAAIAREPVASKELSSVVSLLFATLAGRFISVAVKGLKARVGSDPDRVGVGQWTVVSGEKNSRPESARDKRARIWRDIHEDEDSTD